MALDYKLIGSGVPAPVNLVEAFRTGLAARNDMLANQQAQQNILATQFANSRAPILAQQQDDTYAQNLALKKAEEQKALNEVQLANQQADRKFYDESLGKMGSILYGISSDKEVPLAMQHLQNLRDAGALHPKVYDNFANMVKNNPLTVDGAKYLGTTALSLKDQMERENQIRDDQRAQQKALADQANWQKDFALKQSQYAETVRNNKERNAIEMVKAKKPTMASIMVDPGTALSPEAQAMIAQEIQNTGNSPLLGLMRRNPQAAEVINKAAQGGDVDLAGAKSNYKAESASIANLTKMQGAVGQAEKTALANMQITKDLAKKLNNGSFVPWNRLVNNAKALNSNPDLANFVANVQTVANEVAKVNAGTSGASTDSERAKLYETLNRNQSYPAIAGIVELWRQEMANRSKSIASEIEDHKAKLKGDNAGSLAGKGTVSAGTYKSKSGLPYEVVK